MTREAITQLCALLNNDRQPMGFGGHPMPVALKVALNFYTCGSFRDQPATCVGSLNQQCTAAFMRSLTRRAGDYVHFRTDPESQAEMAIGFRITAGFPQVKGVIDCMHVAIKAPTEQLAAFINRAFTPTTSNLCMTQEALHASVCLFPRQLSQVLLLCTPSAQLQGWSLGDKGYPLMIWLLTPVRNPSKNAGEHYNTCHGSTQATIEQAIGMLKMLFHCLDSSGGAQQYAPDRVGCIIVVCCVLHNIAVQSGEALQDEEVWEQDTFSDDEDTEGNQEQPLMGAQRAIMEG
ncbi:putative nuclease HARBI1 [Heterodontus francisci]|uniref:putative nuclease HARBI1 n=1 Tax=Heterodontus francisci TaxID=7792 RepID=UPI00355C22EF